MDRNGWQAMSKRWLKDAKCLLQGKCWAAAYYLAGYALEFGLEACLLVHVGAKPEAIFKDRKFSDKVWTHSIADLVRIAELETDRVALVAANAVFQKYWIDAKDWNEKSRHATASHRDAKKLFKAIADKVNGVLKWIKVHW